MIKKLNGRVFSLEFFLGSRPMEPLPEDTEAIYRAYRRAKAHHREAEAEKRREMLEQSAREQWWITWFCCPAPGDQSDIPCAPCCMLPMFALALVFGALILMDMYSRCFG